MDNYCSSYYYSLEVKGDTIKIYPPEGQTTISLPREEMENLINDLREISQEENKCVSYRFPANALWETKINCLNAISFILSAAAIVIAIVRLCL